MLTLMLIRSHVLTLFFAFFKVSLKDLPQMIKLNIEMP
jgi:hypothetical protein